MTKNAQEAVYFLVEWYQGGPIALSADDAAAHLHRLAPESAQIGDLVKLLVVLAVPHDSTLFAVFSSPDAEAVVRICQRAGWPADRISTDVQTWLAAGNPGGGMAARH